MSEDSKQVTPGGDTPTGPGMGTDMGTVRRNGRRRRALATLATLFIAAGAGYAAYWMEIGRYQESTDDAYVAGNVVQITPRVSGTVTEIAADDTDFVRAGDVLVKLDPSDAQTALHRAMANLADTVRQVRQLYQKVGELQANVQLHQATLAKLQADFHRRRSLGAGGLISAEDLQTAQTAVATEQAALRLAQHELTAAEVLVDNTTLAKHPTVLQAEAELRDAYLNVQRMTLRAPVSGYVAKRGVQLGQHVQSGSPLMAIVPLDQLWVEANFKENQLRNVRIGQPVTLTADFYGSHVRYTGHVEGLGAGTGSAFALLPPQNATGNWIKIVQRLPVRVSLDPKALAAHPLRIGLSVEATIDTHRRKGPVLATLPPKTPAYVTDVFTSSEAAIDEIISRIIAANGGEHAEVAVAQMPRG